MHNDAKQPKQPDDLLEALSNEIGIYISDLAYHKNSKELYEYISTIKDSDYSISQWTDAIEYILDTSPKFDSCSTAKEYFLHQLLCK